MSGALSHCMAEDPELFKGFDVVGHPTTEVFHVTTPNVGIDRMMGAMTGVNGGWLDITVHDPDLDLPLHRKNKVHVRIIGLTPWGEPGKGWYDVKCEMIANSIRDLPPVVTFVWNRISGHGFVKLPIYL